MSLPTTIGLGNTVPDDRLPAGLGRWLAGAILTLLGLVGAVLLWRRAVGALQQPLPAASLATLGTLLAAVGMATRWLWTRDAGCRCPSQLVLISATLLLMPIATAVSLPGTSPAALAWLWSILVLEEGAAWVWILRKRLHSARNSGRSNGKTWRVDSAEPAGSAAVDRTSPVFSTADPANSGTLVLHDDEQAAVGAGKISLGETVPSDQVTQQFVRRHSAQREDVFSGWLRAEVPLGARTASVHVAFCPPFARTPTVEVHQEDGPPSRIKTVQVLPYGARLDLKLSQPSPEAATVLLRFMATLAEE